MSTIVMFSTLLSLILVAPSVLGHGQVRNFIASSGVWSAADAYAAANMSSPIRKLDGYGPAADFTNSSITCGSIENVPTNVLAPVKAGETVIFDWGDWNAPHSGPVMTYIASCGAAGCANFKGDTGAVWVKIDQDVYNPDRTAMPWGENILHQMPSYYRVTIPAGLQNGQYILRHEILGLHVASTVMGAQFYPNCVQVQVTNGGAVGLPTGIPLPGSYDPHDTSGILVQLWQIQANPAQLFYIAPGGPVLLPGGTGDWGVATYGGHPQPPLGGSTSTVKPTTSTSSTSTIKSTSTTISTTSTKATTTSATSTKTSSSSSAPASTSTGTVVKYGQCGGIGYTGPTACVAGSACVVMSTYYSQCQ